MAIIAAVPRSPHRAVLVRFPPDVYARLVAVASQERRSVSAQIVRFVEEGMARLPVAPSDSPEPQRRHDQAPSAERLA